MRTWPDSFPSPSQFGILLRNAVHTGAKIAHDERCLILNTQADHVKERVAALEADILKRISCQLGRHFPGIGIIAEDLAPVPCALPNLNACITIDPVDGTNLYEDIPSHGVGCMVSLVIDEVTVAAAIADVIAQEVYYFNLYSEEEPEVIRQALRDTGYVELTMRAPRFPALGHRPALLRNHPLQYCDLIERLVRPQDMSGLPNGIQVMNGSIGTSFARLWKGEVEMVIPRRGRHTPWDMRPIIGISQHLGFVILQVTEDGRSLEPLDLKIPTEPFQINRDHLVVHKTHVDQLMSFVATLNR